MNSNAQQEAAGRTLTGYRVNAKRVLQLAAFALMGGAVLAIVFLPTYPSISGSSSSSDPAVHLVGASQTALEVNGTAILAFLAVPFVAAAAPLLAIGRAWQPVSIGSALLLLVCTIITAVTIGVFIVPATIAAVIATFLPPRLLAMPGRK